jgi:hypothetical protein
MPHAQLNGALMWYDDWGAGPAERVETLVFQHGFTAYRRMWGYDEVKQAKLPSEEP